MRRVLKKSLNPLWETNRWDGPLSGFCLYRGLPHYFKAHADYDLRKATLHPLSEESFAYHKAQHEEFREHVGEHCDYEKGFNRKQVSCKPESTWHLFYDKYDEEKLQTDYPKPDESPAIRYFYLFGDK
jgi:hypothetical protein